MGERKRTAQFYRDYLATLAGASTSDTVGLTPRALGEIAEHLRELLSAPAAPTIEDVIRIVQDYWREHSPAAGHGTALVAKLRALAPAAPREREKLTEQELYYLRSIKRSLDEWYSLAPRGGLGGEVLADNRDWLDCFIDQHTRALAPSTSGGKNGQ